MILISILFLLYLLLAFFPFLDYLRLDLKKCKPLFIPNENSEPKLSRYMEEAEVVDSLEAGYGQIFDRFLGVRETANFASSCQLESCYASTITLGTECIVSGNIESLSELKIGDRCILKQQAKSGSTIHVGADCQFHELCAPKITVLDERDVAQVLGKNTSSPSAKETILSKNTIVISSGTVLLGDISSEKEITIEDNVFIKGNIFSQKSINIIGCSHIDGNVFAQEDILVGSDAIIGQQGETKSLISGGKITFLGNCVVFGKVKAVLGGVVSVSSR